MILSLRVPGRLLVGPYVVLLIAPPWGNLSRRPEWPGRLLRAHVDVPVLRGLAVALGAVALARVALGIALGGAAAAL
jgi:hypothetical protein